MRRRDRSRPARHWRMPRTWFGLVAAATILLSLTQPTPELPALVADTPHVSRDGCGKPVRKPSGGFWKCTFVDTFAGRRLDRSKWSVLTTARNGIKNGPECYVDSPRTVSVRHGMLVLSAVKRQRAVRCHSRVTGDFRTRYAAGEVSSLGKFAQAYGRYAFRASFPRAKVPGLHSAIWLWPQKPRYGPWPLSGEIDIAEFVTNYPDRVIPYVHYSSIGLDPTVTNEHCLVKRPGRFHTYVLTWTPSHLVMTINGRPCLDHRVRSALPLSTTAPFDKPFALNMVQALGVQWNAFEPGTTPLPASTRVKFVRVWK
ncbi:MAG: hypothetical protein JWO11_719 [Nocardioides sp.]|nr:hypothetical protein [Nocardioides sp.]